MHHYSIFCVNRRKIDTVLYVNILCFYPLPLRREGAYFMNEKSLMYIREGKLKNNNRDASSVGREQLF